MREHPDKFQAKMEHCRQLASERGDTAASRGKKEFVHGCMQGKFQ